jgi:leader peptidase (prepilin peptidase) / N-methyltransferase
LIALFDLPPALVRTYAVLLGLVGGSFLNVVIYRAPRGMSVARPASHCPACGARIAPFDNVPVLSYLVLRGRARCCGARISPRYAFVEVLGALLSWAIVETAVLTMPGDTSLLRAGVIFTADLFFALGLVAVAFIDLEHMYVPDTISIGGTVLGLATFSLRGLGWKDALLGAVLGFVMVWLPFSVLYRAIRGRTGMGLGDAKLTMMAGAWFGWPGAVFALLAGAVQGTVAAMVLLAARGSIEEPAAVRAEKEAIERELATMNAEEREAALAELARDPLHEPAEEGVTQARIAFGPFLVLAMLEYLLIGRDWVASYVGWLGIVT